MTFCIVPPDPKDSYAVSADWLELLCMLRASGRASSDDLTDPAQIPEDRVVSGEPVFEDYQGSEDDEQDIYIYDLDQERALDALEQEIDRRQKDLGKAYPFKTVPSLQRLILQRACDVADEAVMNGRQVYMVCLLISALRSSLIDQESADIQVDPQVGRHFEVCATIALAGYVGGDAYRFGSPRPDKTSFLDAIQKLTELLKAGKARDALPAGSSTQIRDGGIDVVAWRDHADQRPSKLIVYGQCASGMDWRGKYAKGKAQSLVHHYTQPPSQHWLPALLVPFPLYMGKEKTHQLATDIELHGFYLQIEAEMGLLLDRSRIVNCFIEAVRDIQPSAKEALESLPEIVDWCTQTARSIGADG